VVSYQTLEEQYDVESYFTRTGALMPGVHRAYWLGLFIPNVDPRLWPNFKWLDGYPNPSTYHNPTDVYGHWGQLVLDDGSAVEEPNNLAPPEFCAVANASMAFASAWGWSDRNCEERFVTICKIYPSPPPSPLPPPPVPPPSPPYDPLFVSAQNSFSYFYSSEPAPYRQALAGCQAMGPGGTLVQYASFGRQFEIEDAFVRRGVIQPSLRPTYWMGLRIAAFDFWPNFTWVNGRPLGKGVYEHWGTFKSGARPQLACSGQPACMPACLSAFPCTRPRQLCTPPPPALHRCRPQPSTPLNPARRPARGAQQRLPAGGLRLRQLLAGVRPRLGLVGRALHRRHALHL
jgi:hypothetical protein